MTRFIVLFLILFVTLPGSSRTHSDGRKEPAIRINVTCGFAGKNSASLIYIKNLVLTKNDSTLSRLIFSEDKTLKLLAIAAIENISLQRPILLSAEQLRIISDFKKSKHLVKVGEACEGYYSTTVRRLFRKYKSDARMVIDRGLLEK